MQADYEDCARVVRTGLPEPELTKQVLQRLLDSEALSGLWLPLVERLTRRGQCELLLVVLRHLRHEASRASRTLLAAVPYQAHLRGNGTGLLYQGLLSLFYRLSAEGVPGEALDILWRGLRRLPHGGDDEQYRLATNVLRLLQHKDMSHTETASSLLVKALALPVPPLLLAAAWVKWLEAAAVLWHQLRQRYTSAAVLWSVLKGLRGLVGDRRERATERFPQEIMLMALLRVLRIGVLTGPSFGDACWLVVLLRTALLQLERGQVLAVLNQAEELLQTNEPVWLAASVAGQSPVLLQFFMRRPGPRPLRQLLELALCNVFRDRPDQFSVVLSSVPPLLCLAALLGANAVGAKWLHGWPPYLEVAWGVWSKVKNRLATTGHSTPAGTLAFLRQTANGSEQTKSDGEDSDGEEEDGDRCADCARLGDRQQELSSLRAELAKDGATVQELSASIANKQQKLQELEQKLQRSRRCLRRVRSKEKSLPPDEGKGSAAAVRLLGAIDPLRWLDGEDVDALAAALAAVDELRQKLATEHERLSRPVCAVCLEDTGSGERVLVVLSPCGHAQLCAGCAAQLRTCPLCRRAIEHYAEAS